MKKTLSIFVAITFATMSLITACGGNDNETATPQNNGNGNNNPPATQGSGTLTRGDKTCTLTAGDISQDHKGILLHDQYMTAEAGFSAADEIRTFTYTISTIADEHLLDGGKAWGSVRVPNEAQSTLVSGTIDVVKNGDNYKITINGTDEQSRTVTVDWDGPLPESSLNY